MITLRKSDDRGHADFGWLNSRHSFSFGRYHDPRHMGFGPLRVINEDKVAPGGGFDTHPHRDMEIISYVLDGALAHKDSIGTGATIRPGEVQRMSAGSGILHSEFNANDDAPVHFLQIWLHPDRTGLDPSYEQKAFPEDERRGRFRVVLSPDGRDGSVTVHQDAVLLSALLKPGETASHVFADGRRGWLQVARGAVEVDGVRLDAGDGAAIDGETDIAVAAAADAEVLLFDLP